MLGNTNTWTPADYEMLELLFKQGMTNGELAEVLGRSERAVNRVLAQLGLNRSQPNCLQCGKDLTEPRADGGRPGMYCSKGCGNNYRRTGAGNTPEKRAALTVGVKVVQVICKGCGKQMSEAEVSRRAAKKLPIDYCSGVCAKKKSEAK